MRWTLLILAFFLVSCGGSPAMTALDVVGKLKAAGLAVENVKANTVPADAPLPKSYKEQVAFAIPSLGDKGGQLFVCDTKKNCDAIYAYFDALKALGGPYYYQSPNGLVVLQLNSGLSPDEAAKYEAVIQTLS